MTSLMLDVFPAMRVVMKQVQGRHDHHTSAVVADALLDLVHLLEAPQEDEPVSAEHLLRSAGHL